MKKNIYRLDNIDCVACALKIEEALSKLEGVSSSNLNFMLLKYYIEFDERVISDEQIEEAIHKSLSGVIITEKNNIPYEDTYKEENKNIFKKILLDRRRKR